MASQPTPSVSFTVAEFNSFIRDYHAYRDIWIPVQGEVLNLRREPTNEKDMSAVAIHKEGDVVGHVPYNISSLLSNFLKRECNKGFVEVTGSHVNRGAGYGLEVPCIYRLYGPRASIERIHEIVQTMDYSSFSYFIHAHGCHCPLSEHFLYVSLLLRADLRVRYSEFGYSGAAIVLYIWRRQSVHIPASVIR